LSRGFDIHVEDGRETLAYLSKYRELAGKVKEIVKSVYPEAEVYIFGSVLSGKITALSDIDILIVSNNLSQEENLKVKVEVLREIGFGAPIELHFATQYQLKNWYRRFTVEMEKI